MLRKEEHISFSFFGNLGLSVLFCFSFCLCVLSSFVCVSIGFTQTTCFLFPVAWIISDLRPGVSDFLLFIIYFHYLHMISLNAWLLIDSCRWNSPLGEPLFYLIVTNIYLSIVLLEFGLHIFRTVYIILGPLGWTCITLWCFKSFKKCGCVITFNIKSCMMWFYSSIL